MYSPMFPTWQPPRRLIISYIPHLFNQKVPKDQVADIQASPSPRTPNSVHYT